MQFARCNFRRGRPRQRFGLAIREKNLPFTHTCDCGASYDLREEFVGRRLSCPHCGKEFLVRDPRVQLVSLSHLPHPRAPAAPASPVRDEDDWQEAATDFGESPAASAPGARAVRTITADMLVLEPSNSEAAAELPASSEDGRIEFEKGMSLAPVLSIILILTNAVIFFVTLAAGALQSREAIILAGALVRDRVVTGEYSRCISSMFLHGSMEHLLGNCAALFVLGMACEHAYGPIRTAVIYLAAGIGGALLSMLFSPGPSVGASGAIFGLLGAAIVFFRMHGDRFKVRDNRIGFALLIWAGYSIFTAFLQPYIDNGAHIGGLATGALCGFLMTPDLLSGITPPARVRR